MARLRGLPCWRSDKSADNVINNLTVGLQEHAGLILGCGKSDSYKADATADKNFKSFYLESSAPSGTARGEYLRLKLTGGAGGEALRAFCTVEDDTPADTVNGVHSSLNFGSSAGNVTGLGNALRATLHIPNRALGGTTSAIQAEIFLDGTSSDASGGACSLFRGIVDGGNQAAKRKVTTFLNLTCETGAYDAGYMHATTNSCTIKEALKIIVNGNVRYIPLTDALVAP